MKIILNLSLGYPIGTIYYYFRYITDVSACTENVCKNGGVCDYMKPNGEPKCSCVGGYSGLFCEEIPPGIQFIPNFNETVIHFIQENWHAH